MKTLNTSRVVSALAGALLAAAPANAADGVHLIGQPKTLPFVITQPGSYRLKKNITVPDANTTAVSVQADYVSIDLNGFSIQGPVVCTGSPVTSCSASGTGIGIDAGAHVGTSVRNGTVRGMGSRGLALGQQASSRVETVTASSNAGAGVTAQMVTDSTATANGGEGIVALSVTNSTTLFNKLNGIDAITSGFTQAGTVTGCTANSNGGAGIIVGVPLGPFFPGGLVTGSTANSNGDAGIIASTVTGCEASSNAAGPGATVLDGIVAVTATGCTASHNTGTDISASGVIGHNTCDSGPCP